MSTLDILPEGSVVQPHEQKQGLFHNPYFLTLLGAFALIIVGLYIVEKRSAVAPVDPQFGAWSSGLQTLESSSGYVPTNPETPQNPGDLVKQAVNVPIPTPPPPSKQNPAPNLIPDNTFDFDAFITLLSHPPATTTTDAGTAPSNAYAFIPKGLISTSSPVKKRTVIQAQLYDYGNDVGSSIQSFEDTHQNMSQLIKGYLEDRQDQDKVTAVIQIGKDYVSLGKRMEDVDPIPAPMASAHSDLAKSYQEIGANLQIIPAAQTTDDMLKAINVYNKSADNFAKNFVKVSQIFSANGVIFAPDDAGSVFVFTNTAGL